MANIAMCLDEGERVMNIEKFSRKSLVINYHANESH
jgi:hypothetical protein